MHQLVEVERGYDGIVDVEQKTEALVRQFCLGLGKHLLLKMNLKKLQIITHLLLTANLGYITAF